jgi:hypothetical protein
MLFDFGRTFPGLWRLDRWLQQQAVHSVPWDPDAARDQIMSEIRGALHAVDGPVQVRIQGERGVGKTRLALEIFRDDLDLIIYADTPPDAVIFHWMASHPTAHAILVVDECDVERAATLEQWARMSGHRLRLLTVGHTPYPGASGVDVYNLPRLDDESMLRIVRETARTLGDEQARWVVRVARGYVKLATELAEQVAERPMPAVELALTQNVQVILSKLLPDPRARRAMSGLSLLAHVGWEGEVASEGQLIADFVGIPWGEMQEIVEHITRRGLVSRAGRYRYVTPDMLALWLAADAWRARKSDLIELLSRLSTPESRDAMLQRLSGLRGLPEVADVIDELLGPTGPFESIDVLDDRSAARVFGLLARAHPYAALDTLARLLGSAERERLRAFAQGRREIVWALECMAWHRDTFFGAARLLLRLAEAENESCGNNASGVWASLFQTYLAPTEVPAQERYALLGEALQSDRPAVRHLAVSAIGSALTVREFGPGITYELGGAAPPKRWRPRNRKEDRDCRMAALRLLDAARMDSDAEVRGASYATLFDVAQDLAAIGLAEEVIARLEEVDRSDEKRRRDGWEAAQRILRYDDQVLTDAHRIRLHSLSALLSDQSLHDRLRRYVGQWSDLDWETPEVSEFDRLQGVAAGLADEATQDPATLRSALPWLVSGEAEHVWEFAQRLGELDVSRAWLDEFAAAAQEGPDPRLLSGYLRGRAAAGDDEWVEDVLDRWAQDPGFTSLAFDATWRGRGTPRAVQRTIRLVEQGLVEPAQLRVLVYGGWLASLDVDQLRDLLEQLAREDSARASEIGLDLLTQYAHDTGERLPPSLASVAWTFLERQSSMGEGRHLATAWSTVAGGLLLRDDPVRVARVVLRMAMSGDVTFRDQRLDVLKKALAAQPEQVWNVVGAESVKNAELAVRLSWWAWATNLLGALDPEILLAWARKKPASRPRILAQLVKPEVEISPLVRALIAEYGPDSSVAAVLAGNFESGVWWGGMVEHDEQLLATANGWLSDPEPKVRAWAQLIIRDITHRLPRDREWEEERELVR